MPSWILEAVFVVFFVVMAFSMMRRFIKISQMIQNPEKISELMETPELKHVLGSGGHDPEATAILQEAFKTAIQNRDTTGMNGNSRTTLTLTEDDLPESTVTALTALKHKREIEALQKPTGPSSLTRFVIAVAVLGGLASLAWFLGTS
jgi:hypothetical protein